jgi:hypothetical protein
VYTTTASSIVVTLNLYYFSPVSQWHWL